MSVVYQVICNENSHVLAKLLANITGMDWAITIMTALTWTPEGKEKVGRPKMNWMRTVKQSTDNKGWSDSALKIRVLCTLLRYINLVVVVVVVLVNAISQGSSI